MAPPLERRSPREAGNGSELGGSTSSNHSFLQNWLLVGAAARDSALSQGDVAVLWAVLDRIGEGGDAWPGYGRLAADTGRHRATVGRSVARLVFHAYLTRESGRPGKSNRYRPGRRADATSSADAPSRTHATGVGAPTRLAVGASTRPELASLNPPNESTQKLRAKKSTPKKAADRFAEFFDIYPRREAGPLAEKSWRRQNLDAVTDAIVADVTARLSDPGQWKGTENRFIPLPATYLNGRRWEDDWTPSRRQGAGRLPRDGRSDDDIADANEAAAFRLRGGAIA